MTSEQFPPTTKRMPHVNVTDDMCKVILQLQFLSFKKPMNKGRSEFYRDKVMI
jgi:hypothetical protein